MQIDWLDSARVARRTWPEFAQRGYGLANVCERIGYKFEHHNALEDAKAAGQVLLAAMQLTGFDIVGLKARVKQPVDLAIAGASIKRSGSPDGPLSGELVVFTGALQLPRREAADLAASKGCEVGTSVTAGTTLLVVGDVDMERLAGHEKSSKHRKAEQLVAAGQLLRIIRETDFLRLVSVE